MSNSRYFRSELTLNGWVRLNFGDILIPKDIITLLFHYYYISQITVNKKEFTGQFHLQFYDKEFDMIKNMQCGEFISTDCIYFGNLRCYVNLYPNGNNKNEKGNLRIFFNIDQTQISIKSLTVKITLKCPFENSYAPKIFQSPADVWLVNSTRILTSKLKSLSNIQFKIKFQIINISKEFYSYITDTNVFMDYLTPSKDLLDFQLIKKQINLTVTKKEFEIDFKEAVKSERLQYLDWNWYIEFYPTGWFHDADQFSSLFLCLQRDRIEFFSEDLKKVTIWYEFKIKELDNFLWSKTRIVYANDGSSGMGRFGLLKERLEQFDQIHITCQFILHQTHC